MIVYSNVTKVTKEQDFQNRMSGFTGYSTAAQPAKQKTPTRRKTQHESEKLEVIPAVTVLQRQLLRQMRIKAMKLTLFSKI